MFINDNRSSYSLNLVRAQSVASEAKNSNIDSFEQDGNKKKYETSHPITLAFAVCYSQVQPETATASIPKPMSFLGSCFEHPTSRYITLVDSLLTAQCSVLSAT